MVRLPPQSFHPRRYRIAGTVQGRKRLQISAPPFRGRTCGDNLESSVAQGRKHSCWDDQCRVCEFDSVAKAAPQQVVADGNYTSHASVETAVNCGVDFCGSWQENWKASEHDGHGRRDSAPYAVSALRRKPARKPQRSGTCYRFMVFTSICSFSFLKPVPGEEKEKINTRREDVRHREHPPPRA